MTVSSETNKASYDGDGATTEFSTSFTFASDDEVVVTHIDSAGTETEWTKGTQYTLTGAGTGAAGTVTVETSPTDYTPASGEKLVIQLQPDFLQSTALPRGGTVSPKDVLEPMHDKRVRQMLRMKDDVDRSLKVPISETSAATLPSAASRATFVLAFDSNGDPTVSSKTLAEFEDAVAVTGIAADVSAVADIVADVSAVADIDSYVTTVAGISANVTTVAGVSANVTTVAGISANVTTVAGVSANVTTVAGISANVSTVAGISSAVSTVAGIDSDVSAVAANNTDISTVADNIADILTAAGVASYDIPFIAGWGTDFTGEDVVVQTYGYLILARDITILGEEAYAETSPTGAAMIFDIEKNGTTIYSSKPQIAAGASTETSGTLSTTTADAGDRLTFKITQIGSTVAGQKVGFTLKAELR